MVSTRPALFPPPARRHVGALVSFWSSSLRCAECGHFSLGAGMSLPGKLSDANTRNVPDTRKGGRLHETRRRRATLTTRNTKDTSGNSFIRSFIQRSASHIHTRCTQATFSQVLYAAYVSLSSSALRASSSALRPLRLSRGYPLLSLVHDALWERALTSQPEPLVHALRVAGMDDPAVLLNFLRNEDIQGTWSGGAFGRRFWTLVTGGDPRTEHAFSFSSLGGDPRTDHASFVHEGGDPICWAWPLPIGRGGWHPPKFDPLSTDCSDSAVFRVDFS